MSIVRAVIYFQLLHVIAGLSVDNETHFRWNLEIKQFPDNYFCDGSSRYRLVIDNHRLNDTRKLGFNTIANCHAQCSTRVERLSIENNDFEKVFNNSFCGLQGLTSLVLNDNPIKELERDAFINLKLLEKLWLGNNAISVLPPGVFREQNNTLKYLYFSNNRLDSRSMLELKNLKQLKELHLETNRIDVLPNGVFKHMTQLRLLYLRNNLIKNWKGSLTNLISLEWVLISDNNISVISSEDIQNSINLVGIAFSNNQIHTVENDFCENCDKLAYVYITNASLTTVPQFISKSVKLKTLELSNNKIDQINAGAFNAGEDIDSIDLSKNRITNITNAFTNCTVKQLKLDHNRLAKLSFTDFSSQSISLSITHNNIHTIGPTHDIVHNLRWSLKNLYLSYNYINGIADGSFDHLAELNVLNLEFNNLRHISQNMFKNLNSLTQLFVSHNKIETIESNAFPPRLQILQLNNNKLVNFNVWQLDNLPYLTKLSVSGNKWSCESNFTEISQEWITKNLYRVTDVSQIVCEQPNTTVPPMPHSSPYPETTSINLDKQSRAKEIEYTNGVVNASVWAWLLGLCVCIVMCM